MELAKKTEPAKVVVWGIKEEYDLIYNQVQLEIFKNNIDVVALCCREDEAKQNKFTHDGFKIVTKSKLCNLDIDYLIIANKGSFNQILGEAKTILKGCIILPYDIFLLPRFDFKKDIILNKKFICLFSKISAARINFFKPLNLQKQSNYNWEKKFYSALKECPDLDIKIKNLINNLDLDSTNYVKRMLRDLKNIFDSELPLDDKLEIKHHAYQPFSREELNKISEKSNFIKNTTYKYPNNVYEFLGYKLPIDDFEIGIFLDKYGTDFIENKNYVKNKSIIDAGAYIGDSALVLSDCFPCKNVIAFEPSPPIYNLLKRTIAINDRKNIIPEAVALGAKKGEQEFYTFNENSPGSSLIDNPQNSIKRVDLVNVITLDEYVKTHKLNVGLIKTDLEGSEQLFLQGAKNTIITQKPILLISIYHSFSDFFDIKAIIESWNCGYKFKIIKPKDGYVLSTSILIAEI